MAKVDINQEEAQAIKEMFHVAVQTVGISDNGKTARNSLILLDKINQALIEESKQTQKKATK